MSEYAKYAIKKKFIVKCNSLRNETNFVLTQHTIDQNNYVNAYKSAF